jgi:hypothetical protein
MASATQIADLRRLIDQPDDVAPWTDAVLSSRIDALGVDPDLRALAGSVWSEKAASYAGLVDVKEGNSDRKLSQLHKQALSMAESFGAVPDDTNGRRATRTRQVERQ